MKKLGNMRKQENLLADQQYYWIKIKDRSKGGEWDSYWVIGKYAKITQRFYVCELGTGIDEPLEIDYNPIKRIVEYKTIKATIYNAINNLEVGQSLNKADLIKVVWKETTGDAFDYFIRRSLDAHLTYAKKALPEKKFKSDRATDNFIRIS